MFWVLSVVFYRLFKGNNEDEHKYSEIIIVEQLSDGDHAVAAPPTYTYADEKADTKVAPADAPEQTK
jgi:hypothetical protein